MAIVKKGNNLSTEFLQPGWSVQSDGFGLNTATATFKRDRSATQTVDVRGESFPVIGYNYLKAHKSVISNDALLITTIKVDYVGIDPNVNGGLVTNANCAIANGLTADSITGHCNFFAAGPNFNSGPIAGDPANYVNDTAGVFSPSLGNGQYGWLGNNGACFEKKEGGRFIGFVKPEFKALYGKTQYLAPTTTFSGVLYTSSESVVQAMFALLGTVSATTSWGSSLVLLPSWAPIGTGIYGNKNLLSQANVEEYGSLFKIAYEVRYSKDGWSNFVYINI
jgi:hypothetical protein